MYSLYFRDIRDTLKREMMRNEHKEVVWREEESVDGQCFDGFMQICTDNSATSLERNAPEANPVQAALMNCTYSFRQCLIQNGHTVSVNCR